MTLSRLIAAALALAATPLHAEEAPPPKLVVAISVDQLSADLFAQYRRHFTGGLARLLDGAVFASGYQSHAATETCPGHSTILTGTRPARNGIIANNWFDPRMARADKRVYCSEDLSNPASTSGNPVVSANLLKVPTLGERLKAANPATRNVGVSGKDRSVVMMGGHAIDAGFWWKGEGFTSFAGRELPLAVQRVNASIARQVSKGAKAFTPPAWCAARDQTVAVGKLTFGTNRFPVEKGNTAQLRGSPRIDSLTVDLAMGLAEEMQLGRGAASDVLSLGLSGTDLIGHGFGHQGVEMCIQLAEVDRNLGRLFAQLDRRGIDYVVVLTADHGGLDMQERLVQQALPSAARTAASLRLDDLAREVTARTGIAAPDKEKLLYADGAAGDYYVAAGLGTAQKGRVVSALAEILRANAQVAAVFTSAELAATPIPSGSPQEWSLKDRARASFDAERSGDLVVLLDRAVVPIENPGFGYVATHGSPWDYDRRVPILFWRRGMAGFEQPAPVETVDIAPSLAALLGLRVPEGAFDGRCLDLDGGAANSCAGTR